MNSGGRTNKLENKAIKINPFALVLIFSSWWWLFQIPHAMLMTWGDSNQDKMPFFHQFISDFFVVCLVRWLSEVSLAQAQQNRIEIFAIPPAERSRPNEDLFYGWRWRLFICFSWHYSQAKLEIVRRFQNFCAHRQLTLRWLPLLCWWWFA